jgi:hypothetical protein
MVNGLGIADADPEEFLANIHVARAHTSDHQMLLIDNSRQLAAELRNSGKPVKPLHHRFPGPQPFVPSTQAAAPLRHASRS